MKTIKKIDLKLLKSADKLLVHRKGFSPISWSIRTITRSFWNHCGDIIIEKELLPMITFTSPLNNASSYTYKTDTMQKSVNVILSSKETYKPKKVKKIYVIEALPSGVVKVPIEKYLNTKKYDIKVVRFKEELFKEPAVNYKSTFTKAALKRLSGENYKNGIRSNIRRLKKSVGRKYDFGAIVDRAIRIPIRGLLNCIPLIKKIPQINGNFLQHRKKFFCSECTCVCAYKLPNSRVANPFAGKKHKNQVCGLITPCDVGKSRYVKYVIGTDKK